MDARMAKQRAELKAIKDAAIRAKRAEREAQKAVVRQQELEEGTSAEHAQTCVRSTSGLGGLKFYQVFSDHTGRFYYTNSGERTPIKASTLVVSTSFARELGCPVLFKGQPYRHPKDTSQP